MKRIGKCDIKLAICGLLTTVLLASGQQASAVDTKWGGSIRVRAENKDTYNFDSSELDFYLSQVRLNGLFTFSDVSSVFVELQDARVYGYSNGEAPAIPEKQRNQPFEDKLDLHQAYWDFKTSNGKVRIGRQKFNLGDLRLVASLEWVNTARVHDGVRITLGSKESRTWDLFASRVVSIDPDELNDHSSAGGVRERYADSQFHGLFMNDKSILQNGQLQAWHYIRKRSEGDDTVHTTGVRVVLKPNTDWTWYLQGAYQMGDYAGLDHSAYMFRVAVDKNMLGGNFALGMNYASGDDNPSDGDHQTFDNLYPLNHAYYGYMDFFALQNLRNFEAIYKRKIGYRGADIRIAYQGFWLNDTNDHWYGAGRGPKSPALTGNAIASGADSYVGSELDLTIKIPIKPVNMVVVAGYSHFFTGGYVSDTAAKDNDANFFFVMAKTTF